MLVEHFAHKHATRCGKSIDSLDEGVMARLQVYHWPGNVRELENAIERAVVLTTGSTITRTMPSPSVERPARRRPASPL